MIEVDARGLSCPEPILKVDQALREHPGEILRVLLSEAHSKCNVEKFAVQKNLQVQVQMQGQDYEVVLKP